MSGAAFVDEARSHLDSLLRAESRGPGDFLPAMRRLARRERVSYSALWALRYRPGKDIYASVFFKLRQAHADACQRQLQHLEHELALAEAAGLRGPGVEQARAVVGRARSIPQQQAE